jgi:hypothetical protein
MRIWPWTTPKQDDRASGVGDHKISEETAKLLQTAFEQCKARCIDAVESGKDPFKHWRNLRNIVEESGNCLSTALRNRYLAEIAELKVELDEMQLRVKLTEYVAGVYPEPKTTPSQPAINVMRNEVLQVTAIQAAEQERMFGRLGAYK